MTKKQQSNSINEMEKTFSKIKTLKSRRKLSLPAAASPLMNNAGVAGTEAAIANSDQQQQQQRPQRPSRRGSEVSSASASSVVFDEDSCPLLDDLDLNLTSQHGSSYQTRSRLRSISPHMPSSSSSYTRPSNTNTQWVICHETLSFN